MSVTQIPSQIDKPEPCQARGNKSLHLHLHDCLHKLNHRLSDSEMGGKKSMSLMFDKVSNNF